MAEIRFPYLGLRRCRDIWNAHVIPSLLFVGEGGGLVKDGASTEVGTPSCPVLTRQARLCLQTPDSFQTKGAVFSNLSVLWLHVTSEPHPPPLHWDASHFLPPTQVPLHSLGAFIPEGSCLSSFWEGRKSNYCVFPSLLPAPRSHHQTYRSKVVTDSGKLLLRTPQGGMVMGPEDPTGHGTRHYKRKSDTPPFLPCPPVRGLCTAWGRDHLLTSLFIC